MEQLKSNVAIVMEFLKAERFSASVISLHKICYQELKDFLLITEQSYTSDTASQWVESNKLSWSYRKYTSYRHCIRQLDDVCHNGKISADHLCYRKAPYNLLKPKFKLLIDSFLHAGNYEGDERYRRACARFLLYLQGNGIDKIEDLDYEWILKYHDEDHHVSQKSKDVYEDLIRVFLRFLSAKGKCPFGLSLALNKLLISQIIVIPDEEVKGFIVSNSRPIVWDDVLRFLSAMAKLRYSETVLRSSKHILSLLYIFLDMHHVGINEAVIWHWFNKVCPRLGTNSKQHRRTLWLFLKFLDTDVITTAVIDNPTIIDAVDALPAWEKKPLSGYLSLLKREGWQASTIAMQRSSNLRFCGYLNDIGIKSFDEVTPEIVKQFNLQDLHSTPEGKAAYNCRIRSFIIYLYEQRLVNDPFLYRALPTMTAPRTSIVKTLTEVDVAAIWAVDVNELSANELRDYAIVCIGLTMGFRASDIIALRFSDVNWKQRSICIVQRKTGKLIKMPMPVKTGNILFRYIRDGRPKSNSPYIFIRHEAPYDGLRREVCRRALKRFIKIQAKGIGFHVVRKTFATQLLGGQC